MISNHESEPTLARQTLRTAGVLVAACVLFVGLLSAAAVFITTRAVSSGSQGHVTHTTAPPAAAVKKPLSI